MFIFMKTIHIVIEIRNSMRTIATQILLLVMVAGCQTRKAEWISTTQDNQWATREIIASKATENFDVEVLPEHELQTIDGFGSCFNELGWTSLSELSQTDRETVLKELFTPGAGANFTICRMPVAANDFSLNWYSYNETEGDFSMEHFSLENDKKTLIPFIKAARQYNPELKIWASPWSPPAWMKYNKHYASRSSARFAEMLQRMAPPQGEGETGPVNNAMTERFRTMMDPRYQNDLAPDKEGSEGTDMFILEDPYLEAYALYFSKFIEGYRDEGIDISAVMPQNEFNSAQTFPSCCWTAAGLAHFIGSYLGPAMEVLGVEVYFGTMERPAEALVDTILLDEKSGKYIKGVGFQWAGKDALPGLIQKYPGLKMWQTEQECGDGKNDWQGAMHSWDLMKHYLNHGVSVYEYWNTSLLEGGISRWGWAQNSLVVVDSGNKSYRYTNEYFVLKHASHFVLPGSKKLETEGDYNDILAFRNPDNSFVLVIANQSDESKTVHIKIGKQVVSPELEANSINTIKL
jgi:glucosylceramidase